MSRTRKTFAWELFAAAVFTLGAVIGFRSRYKIQERLNQRRSDRVLAACRMEH